MRPPFKLYSVTFLACWLALAAMHAAAQGYPAKPVRVIVPFPPGAGVDIVTRLVTPKLGEALGQQFIADNRAGAAGNIEWGRAVQASGARVE